MFLFHNLAQLPNSFGQSLGRIIITLVFQQMGQPVDWINPVPALDQVVACADAQVLRVEVAAARPRRDERRLETVCQRIQTVFEDQT